MCALCAAVQDAKQQQSPAGTTAPDNKLTAKIIFVGAPAAPFLTRPALLCTGLAPALSAPSSADRGAPPSPPPRVLA